ncbi:hypothetical protein [Streptomyces fuscigenes]|uniref:hypothetical protein n=1 Tax=Streptomyces fuscigenes TaxID=1528880 RepID=UPI001F1DF17D|nr:hypothetical protein [Streptomyces fuscigenes]MCF3962078.1 hypothetical protein [Streptomyces fuscigenes]
MTDQPRSLGRRALLGGALGAAALLGTGWTGGVASAAVPPPAGPFPPLGGLPPGAPARRLFTPREQRFGPYLAILPGMVNDVVVDDPGDLGFLGGGWWRTPSAPYNSRVQEHVFTLSWFHANSRPWNPYAGDRALLARLDAAIAHYLDLQHADGSWPEYDIDEKSKAATGFGIGYLAKTLANLRQGRSLPQRRAEIEAAVRLGTTWFLDPANPIWQSPINFANQNASGLAGATRFLRLAPDAGLERGLADRVEYLAEHGQSPAGFFYEPTGMDIDYNFEVLMPEIAEIHHLTRNRAVLGMARRFADWFGYNVVREPDGSGSLTYVAMSARTGVAYYDDVVPDPDRTNLGSLFVPEVPALAAFFTTAEDRAEIRAAWAAAPGPAVGPAKQDTSPRIIAHATYPEAFPSRGAKRASVRQLPYLRSDDFAVRREDTALDQSYLYVRRPGLYLAAFFGKRPSTDVRTGPGLLWHPRAGAVVQSQRASDTQVWGSVLPAGTVDAHSDLAAASYRVGDRDWNGAEAAPGSSPVTVSYGLPDGRVSTVLTVTRNTVSRAVRGTTALTEQIPLVLLPTDRVAFADGTPVAYGADAAATARGLVVHRAGTTIGIDWGTALAATVEATSVTLLRDGARRLHVLRVPHPGTLTTVVTLG